MSSDLLTVGFFLPAIVIGSAVGLFGCLLDAALRWRAESKRYQRYYTELMESTRERWTAVVDGDFRISQTQVATRVLPDLERTVQFWKGSRLLGTLFFEDDGLRFEGDADASAKVFVDFVDSYWRARERQP